MSFGIFEAAVSSENEAAIQRQASVDAMAAAVYDVRDKLGPFLFQAQTIEEFRDRVALVKNDNSLFNIIGAHLPPVTGTVRRIAGKNGQLEKEFKAALMAGLNRTAGDDSFPWDEPKAKDKAKDHEDHTDDDDSDDDDDKPFKKKDSNPFGDKGKPKKKDSNPFAKKDDDDSDDDDDDDSDGPPAWVKAKESRRRRAELEGEVKVKNTFHPVDLPSEKVQDLPDWESYKNKVDQNSDKVKKLFASIPMTIYADWCEANNLNPLRVASLDAYGGNLDDLSYMRMAKVITAAGAHEDGSFRVKPQARGRENGDHGMDGHVSREPVNPYLGKPEGTWSGGVGEGHWDKPKTAAGVGELWNKWQQNHTTPGGDYDYEQFANDMGIGSRALDKLKHQHQTSGTTASRQDPVKAYVGWCNRNGYERLSARNVAIYTRGNPKLAIHLATRMRNAVRVAMVRHAEQEWDDLEDERGRRKSRQPSPHSTNPHDYEFSEEGSKTSRRHEALGEHYPPLNLNYHDQSYYDQHHLVNPNKMWNNFNELNVHGQPGMHGEKQAGRRQAAPDYLQKADDALTQLLNQKAEEFQETIAPLQQALVTVQQAEQLQQQQSPLNVQPPAGTVNVMPGGTGPGGAPGTAQQVGMPDPNQPDTSALVQALAGGGAPGGGGLPDAQNGPPPAAGGAPPPDPSQQIAARRRQAGPEEGWKWVGEQAEQHYRDEHGLDDPKNYWSEVPSRLKDHPDYQSTIDRNNAHAEQHNTGRHQEYGQPASWEAEQQREGKRGGSGKGRGASSPYRTAKEPVDIAAEGAKQSWRQMDSAMSGYGYTWDAGANAWTKENHKPIRNHWQHTGGKHDYDPENEDQIFAPARGHGWEHDSGPSGQPYIRPQDDQDSEGHPTPHKHEASQKEAWTGWGPTQFPKARKVANWDWDQHLNGYVANSPRQFECACGEPFPAPTGFHRCACGKQWNSYVIGTGGNHHEASTEKFLVREIPTRDNVIVANRQLEADLPQGGPGGQHRAPGGGGRHESPSSKGFLDPGHGLEHADPYLIQEPHAIPGNHQVVYHPEMHMSPGAPHHPGKHRATILVDPRTGNLHNLVDPGELGEGEEPDLPKPKKTPKDWHHRDKNQRWTS